MAALALILMTLSVSYVTVSSNCPTELKNCTCKSNRVTCDLKGYYALPENITFDLNMLYYTFEQNNISEIGDKQFRNFIRMHHLSLRQNKITNITENALFHNVELRTIDLAYNRLSFLPKNLFKRLDFLETVYLQHNKLAHIETEHFTHIMTLQRVRLNNNQLTFIGKDAFIKSEGMIELYFDFNKLEIPEKDWLIHFKHSSLNYEVYFDNNPWSCDCRMKDFYEWATKNPWFLGHDGRGISVPECVTPFKLRGTRIARINSVRDMKCIAPNITSKMRDIKVVEGEKIELECQATGMPTAVVEISDHSGRIMATSRGSTSFTILKTKQSDQGTYHCKATGFDAEAQKSSQEVTMNVTVYKSPGSVITVILISLFLVGVAMGIFVWIYKKKYGSKAAYGRLPGGSAYYDSNSIAASAKYNAQSMRISPGQETAPASVTNMYSRDTDSADDDDITEYSKDTEFLV